MSRAHNNACYYRTRRTAELTLSRARSAMQDMHMMFSGSREAFFLQVCEDFINCDNLAQGEERLDRVLSRLSTILTTIDRFEDSILNSVGSQNEQMAQYRVMRQEVRDAVNMAMEIQEVVLVGGKADVLCRVAEGGFTFQTMTD
jgi:hypothetical protein